MERADPPVWAKVDEYFSSLLTPAEKALDEARKANRKSGLPAIDVSPLQGKFLEFLVRVSAARKVLEIGTLGGYSTLWLARVGTILIADNVVRQGKVANPKSKDANVRGVQRFTEMLAAEPRLSATVLQTVGAKGYDGFALAVVVS